MGISNIFSLFILTLFLVFLFFFAGPSVCPAGFDCNSYIAMAKNPAVLPEISNHHITRFMPSFIVYAIRTIFPLSIAQGFSILSYGFFAIFLFGTFFYLLRHQSHNPILAAGLTLLIAMSMWPNTYPLKNVYQASDMFCYAFTLLTLLSLEKKKGLALFLISIPGVFFRQNIFVMSFFAFLQLFFKTRDKKFLFYLTFITLLTVGVSRSLKTTSEMSNFLEIFTYLSPQYFLSIFVENKFPTLFLPFLFLMPWCWRGYVDLLKKNWIFSGAFFVTVSFPIMAYPIVGSGNFVRVIMHGIWPLFLLPAIQILRQEHSRYFSYGVLALGVLQGNQHHAHFTQAFPDQHFVSHRLLICLLFTLMLAMDKIIQSKKIKTFFKIAEPQS